MASGALEPPQRAGAEHANRDEAHEQVQTEDPGEGDHDRAGKVALGLADLLAGGGDHVEAAERQEREERSGQHTRDPVRQERREVLRAQVRQPGEREREQAEDRNRDHDPLHDAADAKAEQIERQRRGDHAQGTEHGRHAGDRVQVAAEPERHVAGDEEVGAPEPPTHGKTDALPEHRASEGVAPARQRIAAGKLGVGQRDQQRRAEGERERDQCSWAGRSGRPPNQHVDATADRAAHPQRDSAREPQLTPQLRRGGDRCAGHAASVPSGKRKSNSIFFANTLDLLHARQSPAPHPPPRRAGRFTRCRGGRARVHTIGRLPADPGPRTRSGGDPVAATRRGIALTAPGLALARHAQRIAEQLSAAEAELEAIAGLRSGELRFGWFSTAGAVLVPRAIARFRAHHPHIELRLEEGDPDDCAHALREGDLDLALVYEFRLDRPLPAELHLTPVFEDRLHIALPPGHRLAHRQRIHLAELADEAWIQGVRHGSTVGTLPAACREAGFEPRIAFQTDNPSAWQGLVAAGAGVAVIPQIMIPSARPDIAIVEVDAPSLVRTISSAMPAGRYTPPAARAMADELTAVAARIHDELARPPAGQVPLSSAKPVP